MPFLFPSPALLLLAVDSRLGDAAAAVTDLSQLQLSIGQTSMDVPSRNTMKHPLVSAWFLALSNNGMLFRMRPFDPTADQAHLEKMCENVYGGTDYLPTVAASLASDPRSTFVVLADEADDDRPVAVANLREFLPGKMWLEAVRTCETRRNRGLARLLTRTLVDKAVEDGNEVLTCTVGSNKAMRRVMETVGMRNKHRIHLCSIPKLAALPGWGASDERDPIDLLRVTGANERIRDESRAMKWSRVRSRSELDETLERIKTAGGSGHVPGLWELTGDDPIENALADGMVFRLLSDRDNAVLTLFRDERIGSLKSKWVCSVAACSTEAFESALWHAASQELASARDTVAFAVAFDGAVPVEDPESVCCLLPLADDPCLVYSTGL